MPLEKPERWWLSAAEVAQLFGVNAKTVKRWMAAKHLPGYRLNRTGEYRVLVVHLIRYCKANNYEYVMENFNERYTFNAIANILRNQSGNPAGSTENS